MGGAEGEEELEAAARMQRAEDGIARDCLHPHHSSHPSGHLPGEVERDGKVEAARARDVLAAHRLPIEVGDAGPWLAWGPGPGELAVGGVADLGTKEREKTLGGKRRVGKGHSTYA